MDVTVDWMRSEEGKWRLDVWQFLITAAKVGGTVAVNGRYAEITPSFWRPLGPLKILLTDLGIYISP